MSSTASGLLIRSGLRILKNIIRQLKFQQVKLTLMIGIGIQARMFQKLLPSRKQPAINPLFLGKLEDNPTLTDLLIK